MYIALSALYPSSSSYRRESCCFPPQVAPLKVQNQFFFNSTAFTNGTGNVAKVSARCATELQAPLENCHPYLKSVMRSGYWGSLSNDTLQAQFCDGKCAFDLETYISKVGVYCAEDPQLMPGYPATYWGEFAMSVWQQICLKDTDTGKYCSGAFRYFKAIRRLNKHVAKLLLKVITINQETPLLHHFPKIIYALIV